MACAGVAEFFDKLDVPVVSGMYEENPGVDTAKAHAYVVKTGDSAAQMKKAIPLMVAVANKVITGEQPKPEEDDYFPQGKRLTVITEKQVLFVPLKCFAKD